jgi:hypothetical protein
MTYALETVVKTSKTSQMLEANEKKVLRKIVDKTKIDIIKSQQIRESWITNLVMSGWKEEKEDDRTNM